MRILRMCINETNSFYWFNRPNTLEFPQLEQKLINFTSLPPELHFLGKWSKDEYTDAYLKGRTAGGCPIHFNTCPISVFKLLDF